MKIIIPQLCLLFLLGCNSSKNGVVKPAVKNDIGIVKNNMLQNLQQTGVDFFAQGNQPANWQLTINYDDTVRFTADDGLNLKFAFNQLAPKINDAGKVYTVGLKAGKVSIEINEKICTVATIREVFKREVNVKFNRTMYSGCGKFLSDAALQGKWSLERIGNTPIVSNEYNKIPELNIDIINGKISGYDGCNTINGNIEIQGKRIQFGKLISTKMACNKKNIEKILSTQVTMQLVSYYFKDGRLCLYLPDDSLLVFKKV